MEKTASYLLNGFCFLFMGITALTAASVWAGQPQNDSRDNSVEAVVFYHQNHEPEPESIEYLSWTRVTTLDNGSHKVTVTFREKNRFGRTVIKKQIVIMGSTGEIRKILNCR